LNSFQLAASKNLKHKGLILLTGRRIRGGWSCDNHVILESCYRLHSDVLFTRLAGLLELHSIKQIKWPGVPWERYILLNWNNYALTKEKSTHSIA